MKKPRSVDEVYRRRAILLVDKHASFGAGMIKKGTEVTIINWWGRGTVKAGVCPRCGTALVAEGVEHYELDLLPDPETLEEEET